MQYVSYVRDIARRRIGEGDRLLTLVEGETLLGSGRLDGVHPNDLGFQWMTEGLAPHIARVLALKP